MPEVVLRNENDLYRVGVGGAYDPAGLAASAGAGVPSTVGAAEGAAGGRGVGQQSMEEAIMEAVRGEHGRRRRGKRARDEPPEFVEVRQADLIGERVDTTSAAANALGKEYIQNLRSNVAEKGSLRARRVHQIGTLFRNAQVAEIETLEGRRTQTKNKRETAAKYGW